MFIHSSQGSSESLSHSQGAKPIISLSAKSRRLGSHHRPLPTDGRGDRRLSSHSIHSHSRGPSSPIQTPREHASRAPTTRDYKADFADLLKEFEEYRVAAEIEKATLVQALKDHMEQKTEDERERDDVDNSNSPTLEEVEGLREELQRTRNELAYTTSQRDHLQTKVDLLSEAEKRKGGEAKGNVKEEDRIQGSEKRNGNEEGDVERLVAELSDLRVQLASSEETITALQTKNADLDRISKDLIAQKARLEAEISMIEGGEAEARKEALVAAGIAKEASSWRERIQEMEDCWEDERHAYLSRIEELVAQNEILIQQNTATQMNPSSSSQAPPKNESGQAEREREERSKGAAQGPSSGHRFDNVHALEAELENVHLSYNTHIKRLETQCESLRSSLEKSRRELEMTTEHHDKVLRSNERELEVVREQLRAAQASTYDLLASQTELRAALGLAKEELKVASQKRDVLHQRLLEMNRRVPEHADVEKLQTMITLLQDQVGRITSEYERVSTENEDLRTIMHTKPPTPTRPRSPEDPTEEETKAAAALKSLHSKFESLKKVNRELEEEVTFLTEENANSSKDVELLRMQIDSQMSELKSLREFRVCTEESLVELEQLRAALQIRDETELELRDEVRALREGGGHSASRGQDTEEDEDGEYVDERARAHVALLTTQLDSSREDCVKLRAELASLKAHCVVLQARVERPSNSSSSSSSSKSNNTMSAEAHNQLLQLQADLGQTSDEVARLQSENAKLNAALAESKEEVRLYATNADKMERSSAEKIQAMSERLRQVRREQMEVASERTELANKLKLQEGEMRRLQSRYHESKQYEEMAEEVKRKERELNQAQEMIKHLEAEVHSLSISASAAVPPVQNSTDNDTPAAASPVSLQHENDRVEAALSRRQRAISIDFAAQAKAQLDSAQVERDQHLSELEEMQSLVQSCKADIAEYQKREMVLLTSVSKLEKLKHGMEGEMLSLQAERDNLYSQLSEWQQWSAQSMITLDDVRNWGKEEVDGDATQKKQASSKEDQQAHTLSLLREENRSLKRRLSTVNREHAEAVENGHLTKAMLIEAREKLNALQIEGKGGKSTSRGSSPIASHKQIGTNSGGDVVAGGTSSSIDTVESLRTRVGQLVETINDMQDALNGYRHALADAQQQCVVREQAEQKATSRNNELRAQVGSLEADTDRLMTELTYIRSLLPSELRASTVPDELVESFRRLDVDMHSNDIPQLKVSVKKARMQLESLQLQLSAKQAENFKLHEKYSSLLQKYERDRESVERSQELLRQSREATTKNSLLHQSKMSKMTKKHSDIMSELLHKHEQVKLQQDTIFKLQAAGSHLGKLVARSKKRKEDAANLLQSVASQLEELNAEEQARRRRLKEALSRADAALE